MAANCGLKYQDLVQDGMWMKEEGEKTEGVGDREEDKAAVEPASRTRRKPWLRSGAEVVVVANVNKVGKRWRMGQRGREGMRERMEEKIKKGKLWQLLKNKKQSYCTVQ